MIADLRRRLEQATRTASYEDNAALIAAAINALPALLDVAEAAVAVKSTADELQMLAKRGATSLDAASEHDTAYRKLFAAVAKLEELK